MEKNIKKNLALGLLGLFVLVFALQFVSANPLENLGSWASDTFNSWQSGQINEGVVKVLFFFLVFALIFPVIDIIIPGDVGGSFRSFLKYVAAAIVSFLSLWAIKPGEIAAIMVSYSALGYTFSSIIPLVILMLFTLNLASKTGKESNERLMSKILAGLIWIAFILFSTYRMVVAWNDPTVVVWITVLFPLAGLIILISLNSIFSWIRRGKTNEQIESFRDTKEKARVSTREHAKDVEDEEN